MVFTPEPTNEPETQRTRVTVALSTIAVLGVGIALWLLWPANPIERAMSDGCSALPRMAEALASGDRAAFDDAEDQVARLGFTHFRSVDLTDDDGLIADAQVASTAYSTLYSAAYEPAESNDGAQVWPGLDLPAQQQHAVDAGLAVCERY